ncbi:MAG: hypothetical protein PHN74_00685 [Candidatus Pacebacteria bacterium]|nr:hypothetical protein [Candidatus Paceibacterota bacterium]
MEEFEIPANPEERERLFKSLNIEWLEHVEVVSSLSFYPVPDEWWRDRNERKAYVRTKFGPIAWKNKREIKPGDIILYDRLNYNTFSIVSQKDYEEYRKMNVDTLPIGLFIHQPGTKIRSWKFTSGITWEAIKDLSLLQPKPSPA